MLSKVLTTVSLMYLAFWNVTLCRFVVIDVQKACCMFETSVNVRGWLDEWKDGMDIWTEG